MITSNARFNSLVAATAVTGLVLLTALAAVEAPVATQPPAAGAVDAVPAFSPADLDFFEKQVRPLLVENCFKCHGEKKQKGGLRLDARSLVLKGGDHGAAIDIANLDKSNLLKAINYVDEDMQMPPDGKLPAAKIGVLTK